MARGRDWQHFPQSYYEMLDALAEGKQPEPFVFDCENERDAWTLRNDLYNFFNALRTQRQRFRDKDMTTADSVMCHNWAETSITIILRLDGSKVVASRRPFADAPRLRRF